MPRDIHDFTAYKEMQTFPLHTKEMLLTSVLFITFKDCLGHRNIVY